MGNPNIKERLDRAFVNGEWKRRHPNATVTHLRALNLDHKPILLNNNW